MTKRGTIRRYYFYYCYCYLLELKTRLVPRSFFVVTFTGLQGKKKFSNLVLVREAENIILPLEFSQFYKDGMFNDDCNTIFMKLNTLLSFNLLYFGFIVSFLPWKV